MADFKKVIRRAVDGLSRNTPELRAAVYEKARSAVLRQLENMSPRPPATMIRRQLDKLEDAILFVESEHQPEDDDVLAVPPLIPRQQPGMYFGVKSSGLVGITSNSPATQEDLTEIGGLRGVLQDAVDDLLALTAGSNAYRQIEVIASRYRSALNNERGELLVDLLYAQGVRLESAAAKIRKDIDNSNYPDMDLALAEALESVIAIHGPTVMSTSLGRDLVRRAREYRLDEDADAAYREKAVVLWRDARPGNRLIEPDDMEELIQLNANMTDGPSPLHAASLAHATNSNLLVFLGKLAIYGVTSAVATKAIQETQIGASTAGELTGLIDRACQFFMTHGQTLRALAAVAGGELSWLQSFIRWLETQRKK